MMLSQTDIMKKLSDVSKKGKNELFQNIQTVMR